jgi:thioredoxin reductase (NADPH)
VRQVHMIVRGPALAASMSSYLIERIAASPRISVRCDTEITALAGDHALRSVTWTHKRTGQSETRAIECLFSMIGAVPRTDWLSGRVVMDDKGFVCTGRSADGQPLASPYATTLPGVFAVGDVRSGSVKRVASSVGEGAVVVQAIHRYLSPPPA